MKYFAFVFCSFSVLLAYAQPYEEFTLESEVKSFIDKSFPEMKGWNLGVKVKNSDNQLYLDSIEYSPWHVADFNDDGLFDLFVQMYRRKENKAFLVMAQEEPDVYQILDVAPAKTTGDLAVPFIEDSQDGPLIIYKQYATEQITRTKDGIETKVPKNFNTYYSLGFLRKDTLIYRFDRLIEYASKPNLSGFKYVQIHSYCQFGGCPDYILKVDSVGNMILQNIKNTALDPGFYKAMCDPDLFRNLQLRIKYLQLPKLEMKFGDNTADKAITLIIALSDGRTFKVLDYTTQGTLGLKGLYDFMETIRKNTLW
ncbi:MAG: hypothetical protein IPM48_01450 [Saprospiraceae bacterium]|nr:hypothetical protein [Saprospiraceae bacterium]